MHRVREVRLLVALLPVFCACSGGGGSTTLLRNPAWPKFRHDLNNTGQAVGSVEDNSTSINFVPVDLALGQETTPSAVSASPAISLDGNVYIGSEGGTLLAVNSDLSLRWRVTQCAISNCGQCSGPGLGKLISSPAIYTQNNVTTVIAASTNGCLFAFQDDGSAATCIGCFRPMDVDGSITAAEFRSSPTYTIHPVTLDLTGIFIGASIQRSGSDTWGGKFYALNRDGTLKWQFPSSGDIGPITSSAAFGLGVQPPIGSGDALHFTTDDGTLYTLTGSGQVRWEVKISDGTDTSLPFGPSPATGRLVYAVTTDGEIVAIPPDGTTASWRLSLPDETFAASMALGNQAVVTPTSPPIDATPTRPEVKPTVTPTPLAPSSTAFAVTKSGTLVVVDAMTGREIIPPSGQRVTLPGEAVLSSPALSGDLFLVFATDQGRLHAVNTATGQRPANWPVEIAPGVPIRSSPAISEAGVIYVGADDGRLYAVGLQ
jgi:outer membrane protein assembly factor BamB